MAPSAFQRFPGSRLHYVDRGAWLCLEERRGRTTACGIGWLWRCHGGLELHLPRPRAELSGFAKTPEEAIAVLEREPRALERFAYDLAVLHVLAGDVDAARLLLRAVLVGEAQPEIGAEGLRRALVLYDATLHAPSARALVRSMVDDTRELLELGPWPSAEPSRTRARHRRRDAISLSP